MHWPEAQEEAGNKEPLSTQQNVGSSMFNSYPSHKHEYVSKTKDDHEISRKDTNSHSRCTQIIFYFTDRSYFYLNVKAKAMPPNMTQTGSVLWPKPSSTDCLHVQHSAPGSGSPLALKQGSSNFSQPSFRTLCFHFTAKTSWNMKVVLCQQPHVCSRKPKVSHTKARCEGNSDLHNGPQPFQTIHNYLENKSRKWQSSFVHAAFGEQTVHGNHLIQGCQWPKLTWGQHQRRSRASQRLHTIACPQLHRHSQPGTGGWLHGETRHTYDCSGAQTQTCFTSQANRCCVFSM